MFTPRPPSKRALLGAKVGSRTRSAFFSLLLLAMYAFLAAWLAATAFLGGWAIGLGLTGRDIAIPDEMYDRWNWSTVPDGWETFTRSQVRKHYQCKARDADQEKALPSMADWRLMRTKYVSEVDPAARFDDPVPPTVGYTLDERGPQPYYAKLSKGMGRGLFASRDIKKGEIVHDGDRSDIVFPDGMAWRRYIFSLPRDIACDTTSWNWTQDREGGAFELRSSINIAILMNSGEGDGTNIRPLSKRSTKFVATRDIAKDEEILYDYRAYKTNWSAFGL